MQLVLTTADICPHVPYFEVEQNKNKMQIWLQRMHAVKQQANNQIFWTMKIGKNYHSGTAVYQGSKNEGSQIKWASYHLFQILYTGPVRI